MRRWLRSTYVGAVNAIRRPRDPYLGWHDDTRMRMGRCSYGRPKVVAYDDRSSGHVDIGSFCSIASGVQFIIDGEHRIDFVTSSPLVELMVGRPAGHNRSQGPIVVGHDVWIGRDATILSGVRIGTGAVIGACAVVSADVEPYTIVVGNPARPVRRRFSDAHCEALLASKWWEWPDTRIRAAVPLLWSADVDAFLHAASGDRSPDQAPRSHVESDE